MRALTHRMYGWLAGCTGNVNVNVNVNNVLAISIQDFDNSG